MEFRSKVIPAAYQKGHTDRNCKGHFEIGFSLNTFYSSSALGPIRLPCLPQVMCHQCGAAYTVPGFEEWVDNIIVRHLVLSKESLDKKQVKFLRQHFGFTQDDLAEKIGVA